MVEVPDGSARDTFPDQGPVCAHCGLRIPEPTGLPSAVDNRIRRLMRDGEKLRAMRELAKATGWPTTWAKLWVQHDGRTQPRAPGTTCSYCGGLLRSAKARQCLECGMDWHDPANPRRLGAG